MGSVKTTKMKDRMEKLQALIEEYNSSISSGQKREIISRIRWDYGINILGGKRNHEVLLRRMLALGHRSKKKLLGQVFTPSWIADYMAALAIKDGRGFGIEPCFGKGIFITTMAKRLKQLNIPPHKIKKKIYGIELDPDLFIEGLSEYIKETGYLSSSNNLYLGSFFDYSGKPGGFDFAMMNPPYVRQEDLSSNYLPGSLRKGNLSKVIHNNSIKPEYHTKRSNLYAYFFIQLGRMLKEGGNAVIITYNSWLFSKFGQYLQRFLLDKFLIKYIIDFDQDAFGDALIGSCIILIEKRTRDREKRVRDNNKVRFIRLKAKAPIDELVAVTEKAGFPSQQLVWRYAIRQADLHNDDKWEKYFYMPPFHRALVENESVAQLSELADIYRGTGTKSNRFFLLDKQTIERFEICPSFLTPILKNPRELRSFRTSSLRNTSYLLEIQEDKSDLSRNNESKGVLRYLDHIEKVIKSDRSTYPALSKSIEMNKKGWFKHKTKPPADILFGYIIRRNKSFYLNDKKIPTSDNFYNLVPKADCSCLFAILNSTLVRYLIELCGRTQGSGLIKVQVYELGGMRIPDIRLLSHKSKNKLKSLARELISSGSKENAGNSEIIYEIDSVIFDFLDLDDLRDDVRIAETEIREKRLARRRRG